MILLALLGCPTPTPATVPVEGLEPTLRVVGERILTVNEGTAATYEIALDWPTPDGEAPFDSVDITLPFESGDVAEDGCSRTGRWLTEGRTWRFDVTPAVPGLHCLTRLRVRMTTSISSQDVLSATLETRSVAASVATVDLPLETLRLVVGESRPWVASVWSPERPSGSLLINTSPYPSVAPRTWSTADASIATVADGVITAHASGSTVLTVEAGGVSATADLIVTDAPMGPPGQGLVEIGALTPVDLDDSRWLGDEQGAPVHIVEFGGLRHVLEWTGSGYGLFPIDTPGLPVRHTTAFLHGGRTYVAGFEMAGHRHVLEGYRQVVLDRPTGSAEPWRRRELPTGFDQNGDPVPMQDFTATGVRDDSPRGTDALIEVDAFFAAHDGQLYLATSHHTGQGYIDVAAGEGHCPSTLRLATIGPEAITSDVVDQRWLIRGNDAPPPDCDPVGIDRDHFPEVAVLPAGAFGQRPRVEARGTSENTGFVHDGADWTPVPPIPMPTWTVADTDDGVVVEAIDVFRDGRQCLGLPAIPRERRLAHAPDDEPVEVGGVRSRVTGSTATHFLTWEGSLVDGRAYAFSEQVPCEPLLDDPPALGQRLWDFVAVSFLDAGGVGWLDGDPITLGYDNRHGTGPITDASVERTSIWIAADGVRRLAGGLVLGDGTVLPEFPELGAADIEGDYWFTTSDGLYHLATDSSTPVAVPLPDPTANLARLVGRPGGVVLIENTASSDTWTWIDDAGTVLQTGSADTGVRGLNRSLVGLDATTLAMTDDALLERSSDGLTWSSQPFPGVRRAGDEAFIERRGGTLFLTGVEERVFHGWQASVRTSTDEGVTWSTPSWIHPNGPADQGLCAAAIDADGTAVVALLDVEITDLPTGAGYSGCSVLKSAMLSSVP